PRPADRRPGPFDFPTAVEDAAARRLAVELARAKGIVLPTFAELADPTRVPEGVAARLARVGPDEAHPANLFRVHWFNALDRRRRAAVPVHVELPGSLTGVKARMVVTLGALFPMIGAHKVLAAYACLAPRLVSGRFDPTS